MPRRKAKVVPETPAAPGIRLAKGVSSTRAHAVIVERGRAVIRSERVALEGLERRLGDSFASAVDLVAGAAGRVIVAGVGKSGLVGRKIAATLTSTGTPATFLHPADSVHGDLGIVGTGDVAILISKSGESGELVALLEHLPRLGVRTIAITGVASSTLARQVDVALDAAVDEEACPHDLAPTTSTTAAMALGDALAVALLLEKGFRREDFARLHPGGSLGKRLLTRVADIMLRDDLPTALATATMIDAVKPIAERRGTLMVVDEARALLGVVTAGDMMRLMRRDLSGWHRVPVSTIMTREPRTAEASELGSAAVYRMESAGIMALPVVDEERRVVGIVHLHDLLRAGVA
jgi:arabinose-5-phosphate isomerase